MAEEKMSAEEASAIFTGLKNFFRAAERLEEACNVATSLKAEVSRLKREEKEANDARALAVRDRHAAESDLKTAIYDHDKAVTAHKKALKEEADGLTRFKDQCAKETDRIRAEHMEERKRIMDVTQALEHKRGNLAKEVRQMDRQPGDPEKSAQARLSHE